MNSTCIDCKYLDYADWATGFERICLKGGEDRIGAADIENDWEVNIIEDPYTETCYKFEKRMFDYE